MNIVKHWKSLTVVGGLVALVAGAAAWVSVQDAAGTEITVYKTSTCGCCTKWVDHLRANGFTVTAIDVTDLVTIKQEHGITQDLASCHTALVDGYVVEGHVPADVIRQLLKERPRIAGIAVPGMPMGSPGMEGSYSEPYDVVAFQPNGGRYVFASR